MKRVQVPTPPSFIHFPKEDTQTSTPIRFEKQAAQYPKHIAVKTPDYAITYETLNQQANQLARAIIDLIGRETEPVGLLFDPGIFQVMALLGSAKACKIWVPLDPYYPPARTQTILQQSGARLIITDNKNMAQAVDLAGEQQQLLNIETIDISYAIDNLPCSPRAEDPAYIIFTSGSTGKPKGVVHSHFNTLSHLRAHTNILRLTPHDRVLQLATPNHVSGISDIFRALYNGGTVSPYNLKEQGIEPLADWLISEKITVYHSVPTVFRHLVNTLDGSKSFPDLRLLHTGGEPLSQHDVTLFRKYFPDECILLNNLGSTEASSYRQFFIDKTLELPAGAVPVGYETEGKPVLLLDEAGHEVGPGEVGEITLKSSVLALGYWGEPELTAKAFLPDPAGSSDRIYRTGDMGRLLPDGCLIHLGRKDAQVKIRGERVELMEVEAILFEHPDVGQTAVSLHTPTPNSPQLAAYVIPAEGSPFNPAALREFLQSRVPSFMVPSVFVQVDEMPLTPTGKVDRKALPAPQSLQQQANGYLEAPNTTIEQALVAIWKSVLNQNQVGIHDNFFDLGGHSLLAAQLFTQIEQQFGVNLPLTTLFQAGTIAQLAQKIEQQEGKTTWSSLVALQPNGSQPPFFCVHGLTGDLLWFNELAQQLGPDTPFYGLQSRGLDGIQDPFNTIEEIAAHYITEIQTIQPHGPYFLGGASFGGTVALEMAHQLQQQDEKVTLLVMFDHAPRNHQEASTAQGQTAAILKNIPRWAHNFSKLSPSQRKDRLQRKLRVWQKQAGNGGGKTAVDLIDYAADLPPHRQTLIEANHKAAQQYQPKPYNGPILLFQAETRPLFNAANPTEGWQQLANGNLEVRTVSGSHEGIFQPPHVQKLATHLKNYLSITSYSSNS